MNRRGDLKKDTLSGSRKNRCTVSGRRATFPDVRWVRGRVPLRYPLRTEHRTLMPECPVACNNGPGLYHHASRVQQSRSVVAQRKPECKFFSLPQVVFLHQLCSTWNIFSPFPPCLPCPCLTHCPSLSATNHPSTVCCPPLTCRPLPTYSLLPTTPCRPLSTYDLPPTVRLPTPASNTCHPDYLPPLSATRSPPPQHAPCYHLSPLPLRLPPSSSPLLPFPSPPCSAEYRLEPRLTNGAQGCIQRA